MEKTINLEDYASAALVHKTGRLEFVINAECKDTSGADVVLMALAFGIETKSKNLEALIEEFQSHIPEIKSSGNA